jgi:hypothetical protein
VSKSKDILFTYLKQPLNRYTFKAPKVKEWVESRCEGKTLNLFAGYTKLNIDEIRNDLDEKAVADYRMEALDFIKLAKKENIKFDTILLDPPYSYRKGMEKYKGNYASKFKLVKDLIPDILNRNGKVITFGYHSISLGLKRGFEQEEILLICHGGAQHDTIAVIERLK